MQFTFDLYKTALENIFKNGFLITNSTNFISLASKDNLPKKLLLLRHDCERDLSKALEMAIIEKNLNVKSTYFIRVHSEYYNLNLKESFEHIKEIENLGMEIGLHYEPRYYHDIGISFEDGIKCDVKFLNNILKINIKSISAHQPLLYPIDQNKLDQLKLVDMYTHPYLKKLKYLSDSGMNYRETSLNEFFHIFNLVQFLIHPDFWNKSKELPWDVNLENLSKKIKSNLDDLVSSEIKMYNNYIKNRKKLDQSFKIK